MFDAHCHLDDPRLSHNLHEELSAARAAGVRGFLCAGFSPERWQVQVEAVADCSDVYHGFGIHPWSLKGWSKHDVDRAMGQLYEALQGGFGKTPVVMGEFGLHRVRGKTEVPFALQEYALMAQLSLAKEHDWPIILHCVGAHGRMLELLKASGFRGGGMIHGFSGSLEVMREYVKRGLKLSFSGLVTRPGARKCREAAAKIPLSALLTETDAPDQIPISRTGSYNRLSWLPDVIEALVSLREEPHDELAETTELNAKSLFRLDTTCVSDG